MFINYSQNGRLGLYQKSMRISQLVKLRILVKAQPALQAPGHCHQLGLAYGRKTWAYPTNTLSATVAFLLLLDTNLLQQPGITHYSQLHDMTAALLAPL